MNPEDLSSDADPRFLAEFYKNLKILSQDLYKKSAGTTQQNAATAHFNPRGTPGASGGPNRTAKKLRSSFGGSFR